MKAKSNTLSIFQTALVAKFGEGSIVTLPQMEEVVSAATEGRVTCVPAAYRSNKVYHVGKGKWVVTAATVLKEVAPKAEVPAIAPKVAPIEVKPFSKVSGRSKAGRFEKKAA